MCLIYSFICIAHKYRIHPFLLSPQKKKLMSIFWWSETWRNFKLRFFDIKVLWDIPYFLINLQVCNNKNKPFDVCDICLYKLLNELFIWWQQRSWEQPIYWTLSNIVTNTKRKTYTFISTMHKVEEFFNT